MKRRSRGKKRCSPNMGWQVSINDQDGYWYFYSLAFANLEFPDGQFLRQVDWEEYLADMNQVPGSALSASLRHLRTFEIDRERVRWPVAMIIDRSDLMADMPSSRGTFERRLDMVEHCHLQFENDQFLLVKQFDEMTGQLLLLASSRDPEQAEALLEVLGNLWLKSIFAIAAFGPRQNMCAPALS